MNALSSQERAGGQPAIQPRSRQTLESLLQAAEELIEERDYNLVSMADIAARAGRAVGSLYSRIGTKDELMLCLYDRYLCATEERIDGFVSGKDWTDVELPERIQAVVGMLVDNYARRRGIVRALNLHPMPAQTEARYRPRISTLFSSMARLLAAGASAARGEPGVSQSVVEFGLLVVISTARGRIVDGADSGITRTIDVESLKRELSWILRLYLTTARDAPRGDSPSITI